MELGALDVGYSPALSKHLQQACLPGAGVAHDSFSVGQPPGSLSMHMAQSFTRYICVTFVVGE